MDPQVKYLLSLQAIRERAKIVGEAAEAGKLNHFDLHEERLDDVVQYVTSVIKRDFGPDKFDTIPPHGRWQHFEVGGVPRIANMMQGWEKAVSCDSTEMTRRLVDLFFVSVLLDAGAGDHWRYTEPGTGRVYERSEGIAVASLYMFNALAFATASTPRSVPIVDGKGLEKLTPSALKEGFQVTGDNPMLGIETRAALLNSLGRSLLDHPNIFGAEGRPGNLVDYMISTSGESSNLDVFTLWDVLQTLLIPIWPKDRTTVNGVPIGDAWPLKVLSDVDGQASAAAVAATAAIDHRIIQPFHKLTQWLTYSLMVPFQRVLRPSFSSSSLWTNADALTALPEYRNGGLFVDLGVLALKPEALERGRRQNPDYDGGATQLPLFEAGDDVIVEWRAMTLVLIDRLYRRIAEAGEIAGLSMAQLLEAGTWKSGREKAAALRPRTKSSPILIRSDGTVF